MIVHPDCIEELVVLCSILPKSFSNSIAEKSLFGIFRSIVESVPTKPKSLDLSRLSLIVISGFLWNDQAVLMII